MRHFRFNLMPAASQYCFLKSEPAGLGLATNRLSKGISIADEYPSDVRYFMDPDEPGIQVPDLVGNPGGILVVSRVVKQAIENANHGPTEYLPISIYNHKKRLAAADYFVINPLGTQDCLDPERSRIEYHNDKVVGVDRMVLKGEKLKDAPDLFRVREAPRVYVASENLVRALLQIQPRPTNVFMIELEQS